MSMRISGGKKALEFKTTPNKVVSEASRSTALPSRWLFPLTLDKLLCRTELDLILYSAVAFFSPSELLCARRLYKASSHPCLI